MFGTIGVPELLVIFAILFFIFGGKKIPELARGLAQGIRGLKSGLEDED